MGKGHNFFSPLKREGHEKIGSAKGRITHLCPCDHKEHCILKAYIKDNKNFLVYKNKTAIKI